MTTPVISVHGLRKAFDGHQVLGGIDLHLDPAEHVALIGNNGQGKTTLMRVMLGVLPPDGGEVRLRGRPVGFPRAAADKRMIGYMPETVSFWPNLTGRRTLHYFADLKGASRAEADSLLERVGLGDVGDGRLRTYSKGMRQRLGLAQALLGSPEALLLDEPTNGLDPEGIHEFYGILRGLQRDGVAILMASHVLSEIEPRLDRLAVMRHGTIEKQGPLAQLTREARLPSTISFSLREPQQGLPAELRELSVACVPNGSVGSYQLTVDGAEKFKVLEALVHHADRMDSLVVRDPGLEELFRRIQEQGEGPTGSGHGGEGRP